MNVIWRYFTDFNNFFDFCDTKFSCFAHGWIEIHGRFAKYQISSFVSFPSLDQSKVTRDGLFHDVICTVKDTMLPGLTWNFDSAIFGVFDG